MSIVWGGSFCVSCFATSTYTLYCALLLIPSTYLTQINLITVSSLSWASLTRIENSYQYSRSYEVMLVFGINQLAHSSWTPNACQQVLK